MTPDQLDINSIKLRSRTSIIGSSIIFYDTTVSTNIDAIRLANEGAADGTVVITDEQTGGRGRFDRVWLSPAGQNILMSVILRPRIEPSRLFLLTIIASLAVAHAVEEVAGITAGIKWPNDVYIGHRKVCGILTEMGMNDGSLTYAVVGMGINANAHPELGSGHSVQATSIAAELGREVQRADIIASILHEMDRRYRMLLEGSTKAIVEDWTAQSVVLGRRVTISDIGKSIEGVAESFDEQGRLILLTGDGSRITITSGDVTLRV
jgi:BirA family transcriptional regulator, biotin operon repressor / biotin---[acetyl-CoA-carboxylase] ligase